MKKGVHGTTQKCYVAFSVVENQWSSGAVENLGFFDRMWGFSKLGSGVEERISEQ